jgi:hypothetical protein
LPESFILLYFQPVEVSFITSFGLIIYLLGLLSLFIVLSYETGITVQNYISYVAIVIVSALLLSPFRLFTFTGATLVVISSGMFKNLYYKYELRTEFHYFDNEKPIFGKHKTTFVMAEQEIIKHAEKVIETLHDKKIPFWHKLKDALYEIAIIVFAVTISIWFHNWSEHSHQQKEVKEFLLGLKKDIIADTVQIKKVIHWYEGYENAYTLISKGNPDVLPNKDSLKVIKGAIQTTVTLHPNQSRFNGFLSAGKVTNIENAKLQLDILNYYQNAIPTYLPTEEGWNQMVRAYIEYRINTTNNFDDDKELWKVIASPRGRYYSSLLIQLDQMFERLNTIKTQGQSIIQQIDTLYPTTTTSCGCITFFCKCYFCEK